MCDIVVVHFQGNPCDLLTMATNRNDRDIFGRVQKNQWRYEKIPMDRKYKAVTFRPTGDSHHTLMKVYDKSRFINKAIFWYSIFLWRPLNILIQLKKVRPQLWKYANRKRFIN